MSNEVKKDLDECRRLYALCIRPNIQSLLNEQVEILEKKLAELTAVESKAAEEAGGKDETSKEKSAPRVACVKIDSYGWDQTDSFLKIYALNLKGVQSLPSEKVNCHFSEKGFNLVIHDLNSKNHQLQILSLYDKIIPEESKIKIKTDSILVMLKKAKKQKWDCVTEAERRREEQAKMSRLSAQDKSDDPNSSIMNMMRQMYEDGDDDMKRTIAKAWTESQDKKAAGDAPF